MKPIRSFASDNNAGVHPEVLEAIQRANEGHAVGYGDDPYTQSAVAKFHEHFGADAEVFFVFNGTAANVLSLQALTRPHHAVLCPELSHIYTDECGAPEKFTGCKLIPLPAPQGKLTVETLAQRLSRHWRPASRAAESSFDHAVHRDGHGLQARAKSRRWRDSRMSGTCFCTWTARAFQTLLPRRD